MAPVSLDFVTEVLQKLLETPLAGIVQVSGECDVTYEDVAYRIAEELRCSQTLVQPSLAAVKLPGFAARKYTTLDTRRLREQLHLCPPPVWSTVLQGASLE